MSFIITIDLLINTFTQKFAVKPNNFIFATEKYRFAKK